MKRRKQKGDERKEEGWRDGNVTQRHQQKAA